MEWQWDQSFAFGSTLAEKPELAPDDGKSYLPQTGGSRHHTGRKGFKRGGSVKKLKHWRWEELDNAPHEISYWIKKLKIQMNPTQNFLSHAQSLALRAHWNCWNTESRRQITRQQVLRLTPCKTLFFTEARKFGIESLYCFQHSLVTLQLKSA